MWRLTTVRISETFDLVSCQTHDPCGRRKTIRHLHLSCEVQRKKTTPTSVLSASLSRGGAPTLTIEASPWTRESNVVVGLYFSKSYFNHGLQIFNSMLLSPYSRRLCTRFGHELAHLVSRSREAWRIICMRIPCLWSRSGSREGKHGLRVPAQARVGDKQWRDLLTMSTGA